MHKAVWFCSVLIAPLAFFGATAAQPVSRGVANRPETGRGNHRVVLRVDREFGDVAFQPVDGPGEYHAYYLPCNPPKSHFDDPGACFPPVNAADPAWRARHGLAPADLERTAWRSLPKASVVQIQARGEFHRFDPMELIATAAETRALRERFPKRPFLLFPEDREHAVSMTDDLPRRWIGTGPRSTFTGNARPNEYYTFQIAVWAAREAIADLQVEVSDLEGAGGTSSIPAEAVDCFNLAGSDWLGRPFRKTVNVPAGRTQALWFGVPVPAKPATSYRGRITVHTGAGGAQTITLTIDVAGKPLPDRGDSDPRRMSRLRWLNSSRGIDDEVVAPFIPLEVDDSTIRLLNRSVRFGPAGLPAGMTSNGREIPASPMAFHGETDGGPVGWTPGPARVLKQTPATVERLNESSAPGMHLSV